MSLVKKSTGAALALAAAAALTGCYESAPTKEASVAHSAHCYGVNKCKGHNDCKSAENACKGHATCKGQGFVAMSEKACEDVGGTVGK